MLKWTTQIWLIAANARARPRLKGKEAAAVTAIAAQLAQSPERFFNRELSWLEVQHSACWRRRNNAAIRCSSACASSRSRPATSMSSTPCVAGLREQVRAGITRVSQDGLTPAQQLDRSAARRWPCSRNEQQRI
jgi:polyphosphate kinase